MGGMLEEAANVGAFRDFGEVSQTVGAPAAHFCQKEECVELLERWQMIAVDGLGERLCLGWRHQA